jgi:hypothetical protein
MNAVMRHKVGLCCPSHFTMLRWLDSIMGDPLAGARYAPGTSHGQVAANAYLIESRFCMISKYSMMEGLRGKNRWIEQNENGG